MARKPRDHKAEYLARKRKATQLGYRSEREYKAARKNLGTPRNQAPPPKATVGGLAAKSIASIRREAKDWSDAHSHVENSRYRESMTDEQARKYWRAFVEHPLPGGRKARATEKRKRIHDYLVPDLMDEKEWKGTYLPV